MSKNFSFFKLNKFIADRNDWDTAHLISSTILLKHYPFASSFDNVAAKMLLTTSILSIAPTKYPDLLTARAFLLLPSLKDRLSIAEDRGKLSEVGIEVINGIVYFLECPDDRLERLILLCESAIDLYLTGYELPEEAMTRRTKYLDEMFSLPNTVENFNKILLSA